VFDSIEKHDSRLLRLFVCVSRPPSSHDKTKGENESGETDEK
jgi:hypothetical protein